MRHSPFRRQLSGRHYRRVEENPRAIQRSAPTDEKFAPLRNDGYDRYMCSLRQTDAYQQEGAGRFVDSLPPSKKEGTDGQARRRKVSQCAERREGYPLQKRHQGINGFGLSPLGQTPSAVYCLQKRTKRRAQTNS